MWDLSPAGLGVYEGAAAARRFFEDWRASYGEFSTVLQEVQDLGSNVTFASVTQTGRLAQSSSDVRANYAAVLVWAGDLIVFFTNYPDIAEGRAAAELLAQQRG